jgi:hypothetical protein
MRKYCLLICSTPNRVPQIGENDWSPLIYQINEIPINLLKSGLSGNQFPVHSIENESSNESEKRMILLITLIGIPNIKYQHIGKKIRGWLNESLLLFAC